MTVNEKLDEIEARFDSDSAEEVIYAVPSMVKALRAVLELIEDDVAFGDLSGSLAEAIEARPAAYHSSVGVVAVQRCYASGIAALATRLVRDRLRAAITEALGGAE